ncbi:MAG: hypothetical protein PVI41_05410 [Roseobacter sp.]|jgi:hypothetical protein
MKDLNARLLHAHKTGDARALVLLYSEAAAMSEDENATGFYLTHAYVYALDAGHPAAQELRQKLIDMGRETPLQESTDIRR